MAANFEVCLFAQMAVQCVSECLLFFLVPIHFHTLSGGQSAACLVFNRTIDIHKRQTFFIRLYHQFRCRSQACARTLTNILAGCMQHQPGFLFHFYLVVVVAAVPVIWSGRSECAKWVSNNYRFTSFGPAEEKFLYDVVSYIMWCRIQADGKEPINVKWNDATL